MYPTCTRRRPNPTSASMIRRHASWVVARGFSQKTGLPGGDRRENVLLVGGSPRADDDGVDRFVRDELLAGREDLGAGHSVGDPLGLLDVDVGDRDHGGARHHLGEATDVVLADHSDADDADVDGHAVSLDWCGREAPRNLL
jgi:hypothetical protein